MTHPTTYDRVCELFREGRRLEPAQRAAFLERVEPVPELRREVLELLDCGDSLGGFLEHPPLSGVTARSGPLALETPIVTHPARIGPYAIRGVLGEGGMGVVYRAEQDNPRREVALKLVRSDSAAMLRRFELETRALARLAHPGVAQIHDAGVADLDGGGLRLPYFAMELVRGEPLNAYADRCRLSVAQRVELLARVCDAVQYAHLHGVIHRDLKPANILVPTDDVAVGDGRGGAGRVARAVPTPKVLDFGVARLVAPAGADDGPGGRGPTTLATCAGQIVGTIPYMSPEQIAGGSADVDTRTDVYSLGVIGYELLTGSLPHDVRGLGVVEAARIITTRHPTLLGMHSLALRGDLEVVFAKALEPDRDRRYVSAADLAADLRRVLRNDPIAARGPSAVYLFRKFAQRNRALVGGAAATLLSLVAGVAATSLALISATAERDRAINAERLAEQRWVEATRAYEHAETEADKARRIQRFLEDMLASMRPSNKQADALVRDLLDEAADRLDRELAGQPQVRAALLDTIGRAYLELGLREPARVRLEAAADLRRGDAGGELALAETLTYLAAAQGCGQVELERALALCDEAIALREQRLGPHHPTTIAARQLRARALWQRGDDDATWDAIVDAWMALSGLLDDERFADPVADAIRRGKALAAAADREALSDFLWNYRLKAGAELRTCWAEGRRDDASAFLRRHYEPLLGLPVLRNKLPWMFISAAAWLRSQGEDADAIEPVLCEAIDLARRVEDPHAAAAAHARLGTLLVERGEEAAAVAALSASDADLRRLFGDRHPGRADALLGLGLLGERRGEAEAAEQHYREALAILAAAGASDHVEASCAAVGLGSALLSQGRVDEAAALLARGYERLASQTGELHPWTRRAAERLRDADAVRGETP